MKFIDGFFRYLQVSKSLEPHMSTEVKKHSKGILKQVLKFIFYNALTCKVAIVIWQIVAVFFVGVGALLGGIDTNMAI